MLWAATPDRSAAAQAVSPFADTRASSTRLQPARSSIWEIEGYGGLSLGRLLSGGSRAVPPPGPPILTSSPSAPSRQVSSWLFGDGATLLNGVNAEFNIPSRVIPLDAAFSPLSSSVGGAGGVRVRRKLTSRYSAEFSLDLLLGSAGNDLAAAAAATRGSFATAFADLVATGPFVGGLVDATSTPPSRGAADLAATGAISMRFAPRGGFVPYVTGGAGITTGIGRLPSTTVEAHYRFSIIDTVPVPIDETDRVVLRYAHVTSFVGVAGGGLSRELSGAWGVRIDGRVFVGPNNSRLLLDATPSIARGAPAGFVESFTAPAIQFSNDPATGRQSTLSGAAIHGFAVSSGGIQTRVLISFVIFRKI
jgi:hypothetical protein